MRRTIQQITVREPVSFKAGLALQKQWAATLENNDTKTARLIFLQHRPVYTLGRAIAKEHLLCSEVELAARTGAEVVAADRGGSVTYHAPGQLTAYLLLNLKAWDLEIHKHLSKLESTAIEALRPFGITGSRQDGMTGVWVSQNGAEPEKICAIGVSARRWVTYHGLALNVNIDLKPFFEVVPCGLSKGVTSMARILEHEVPIPDVENMLARAFAVVYAAQLT